MRPTLATLLATSILAASLAGGADARRAGDRWPHRSDDLWATVNICDTADNPDRIGVRGSMPGLRRRAKLQMRFRVQYVSRVDGKWHNVEDGDADTGWVTVGRTRRRVIEAGHTFKFLPPADGGAHTLRGAVTFRWRRHGRTLERIREVTEGGHRSTTADPPRHSAAICKIS